MGGRRISVIVPAYNIAPYLGRCLDSLLAQTHVDLEIIVVDDGSKDGTGAILEAYAELRGGSYRSIRKTAALPAPASQG